MYIYKYTYVYKYEWISTCIYIYIYSHCNTLHHTATHCNALQHRDTATHVAPREAAARRASSAVSVATLTGHKYPRHIPQKKEAWEIQHHRSGLSGLHREWQCQ